MSITIQIDLPEDIVQRAKALGLLEKDSIAELLTEAVRLHAPAYIRFWQGGREGRYVSRCQGFEALAFGQSLGGLFTAVG